MRLIHSGTLSDIPVNTKYPVYRAIRIIHLASTHGPKEAILLVLAVTHTIVTNCINETPILKAFTRRMFFFAGKTTRTDAMRLIREDKAII